MKGAGLGIGREMAKRAASIATNQGLLRITPMYKSNPNHTRNKSHMSDYYLFIHLTRWVRFGRSGLSRGVKSRLRGSLVTPLVSIGLAVCYPASAAAPNPNHIDPKAYIKLALPKEKALCLIKLYGKESAFNPYAIGNLDGKIHTYGIPQIKNPIIYEKSPIDQVRYGIKYINARYEGDSCKAWLHFKVKGWH